jgi:hypothetical protein
MMLSRYRPDLMLRLALLLLPGLAGCVERRLIIDTDPPGAIVYDEKNNAIGASPVDKPFTYYGNYRFRFAKDGYETIEVMQPVRAPWYEWPGLDFISENLIPWNIRDVRYYKYALQPAQVRTPDQLMREGQALKNYGMTIGDPAQLANPNQPVGIGLLPPTP